LTAQQALNLGLHPALPCPEGFGYDYLRNTFHELTLAPQHFNTDLNFNPTAGVMVGDGEVSTVAGWGPLELL
jgi:hypothetical protein